MALLVMGTAALFLWFIRAFMADNNNAWTTSEPVQILTGFGALAGIPFMLAIVVRTARRAIRRRRPTRY